MTCGYSWCDSAYDGHSQHVFSNYTAASDAGRLNLAVGAGYATDEDGSARIFVHIADTDGEVDEDVSLSIAAAEELCTTLAEVISIARGMGDSAVAHLTVVDSVRNSLEQVLITDGDGTPKSVIGVSQLKIDAARLMYEVASTAGDDDATGEVAKRWAESNEPEYYAYLTALALTLMTSLVLAPALDCCEAAGAQMRDAVKDAAASAEASRGGDRDA